MNQKKESNMRLATRFSALLEQSGWGVNELADALGYDLASKSSVMRWKQGLGVLCFQKKIPALIRLLSEPETVEHKAHPDSAARLRWMDPGDRDGVRKLLVGILEEPDDDIWLERLRVCAPARVAGRRKYQRLKPHHDTRAFIEMQLQKRDDPLAGMHQRIYRYRQNSEGPEVNLESRFFRQTHPDAESTVRLDIPDEEDAFKRLIFHTLGCMIQASVDDPDLPLPVPVYTSSPSGCSYELVRRERRENPVDSEGALAGEDGSAAQLG